MEDIQKVANTVVGDFAALLEKIEDNDSSKHTPEDLPYSIYEAWQRTIGSSYRINEPVPHQPLVPFNLLGILQPFLKVRDSSLLMADHLKHVAQLRASNDENSLVVYLYHLDSLARLVANNKTVLEYQYDAKSRSLRFEYLVTHWRIVAQKYRIYENKAGNNDMRARRNAIEFCISTISHMVGHMSKKKGTPFTLQSRLFHIDSPSAISNNDVNKQQQQSNNETTNATQEDSFAMKTFFGGVSGVETRLALFKAMRYELYYEYSLTQLNVKGGTFSALIAETDRLVKLPEIEDLIGITHAIAISYTDAVKASDNNKFNADKETDCFLVMKAYLWRWLTSYLQVSVDFDAFKVTGDMDIGKQALKRIEDTCESQHVFHKEEIAIKGGCAYSEAWLTSQYDVLAKNIEKLYVKVYDQITASYYETSEGVKLLQLVPFVADIAKENEISEAMFAVHAKYEKKEPLLVDLMHRLCEAIHNNNNTLSPSLLTLPTSVKSDLSEPIDEVEKNEEDEEEEEEEDEDIESLIQNAYHKGVYDERKRFLSHLMEHVTTNGKMIVIPAERIRDDYVDLCL